MNKTTIFIVNIAVSLLVCTPSDAQVRRSKKKKIELNHEFSLYGAGGLSGLSYQLPAGKKSMAMGVDAGLGYTYFLRPQWGVGTGAGIALFNASASLDGFNYTISGLVDNENDVFDLYTSFDRWKEKQRVTTLMIPLMATYRTKTKTVFYFSAGGKAGIPLSASCRTRDGVVTKRGYFPEYDNWGEGQQFMGFGTFTGVNATGKMKTKAAFFASAEAGAQWKLKDHLFLYAGAYFDYGLNSIIDNERLPLVTWNAEAPKDFNPAGILNARINDNTDANGFTDRVTPIAAGVKLRLAFGVADHAQEKKQKQKELEEKRQQQAAAQAAQAEQRKQQAEQHHLISEEAKRQYEEAERQKLAIQQQLSVEEAERQRLAEQEAAYRRLASEEAERAEYRKAVKEIERTYAEFTIDQIEMNPSAEADLDQKIELMQRFPNMRLIIEGHTCNIGGHAKNVRVGQRRADYAKQYLVNKGIAPERITAVTKAETEPVVPNASENNRRKNRRIEIKVVE